MRYTKCIVIVTVIPWPARSIGLATNLLHLSLSVVIITAPLMSWPLDFKTLSVHLWAGRPDCLLPSTIPNTSVFNSLLSVIPQMWSNSWSFLFWMVSITVHSTVLDIALHHLLHGPVIWLPVSLYIPKTTFQSQTPAAYADHLSLLSMFVLHILPLVTESWFRCWGLFLSI